ncbi:MAG: hypothetical protein BKP49_09855 [Treponema sp. CETP13]|nr:MAG: hypothetical protein BKP49_09855 [Treponema sp. CETP13]
MKKKYFLIITVIILSGLNVYSFTPADTEMVAESPKVAQVTRISAQRAKEIIDTTEGYIILDVRTVGEYESSHIPGALLIPDYELKQKAPTMLKDKDQVILVYCRSGNRSAGAARNLVNLGYTNIYDFGGIISWPYEVE